MMTKHNENFYLGQHVKVRAEVYTDYYHPANLAREVVHEVGRRSTAKNLYRHTFPEPLVGIIVGYTWRATGWYKDGHPSPDDEWGPPYLAVVARYKLWMVATTLRYQRPLLALATDIEEGK